MIIFGKNRIQDIINQLAKESGSTPEKVRASMQAAIDEAWKNRTGSAETAWKKFFPGDQKPTVEEFLLRLRKEVQAQF